MANQYETSTSHGANRLRPNSLGVAAMSLLVISGAAPLTAIAGGTPIGMLLGNGAGIAGAYLAATFVLLLFSVGYTTMARHISNAGAFYAFVARGLGGSAGGAAALIVLIAYNFMQISLYGLFGVATRDLAATELGISLPWWIFAFAAMALIAFMGYRRVDLSARLLGALVLGEFAVVIILDISILHAGGASGFSLVPFTLPILSSGAPIIGILFCFGAFVGFEATTIYSEEAKRPTITVPRATYISVLAMGGFYTFTAWCLVVGQGVDQVMPTLTGLADPLTFAFSLSDRYAGPLLSSIMSVLFVTSLFAALLAFHNNVARYFYALGRERLLPAMLGRTHGRHQSPHIGSMIQTALALVALATFAETGSDPVLILFSCGATLATLGVIMLMALTSFAVIAFFRRNPGLESNPLNTLVFPLLSGLVLTLTMVLVMLNFTVLTGADVGWAVGLVAVLPAAAIVGLIRASVLKMNNAGDFARLGMNRLT